MCFNTGSFFFFFLKKGEFWFQILFYFLILKLFTIHFQKNKNIAIYDIILLLIILL